MYNQFKSLSHCHISILYFDMYCYVSYHKEQLHNFITSLSLVMIYLFTEMCLAIMVKNDSKVAH